ncbi:MAG: hypothetical protein ACJA0Q_001426 [Saprospiraceae bacterium]|jgi:hypothetical protein
MNFWKNGFLVAACLFSLMLNAQDDEMDGLFDEEEEPTRVIATFKSTHLINAQTNETVKKKSLDFRIAHRFGNIGGATGGVHTLYGLDNATNVRFSFDYGITDKFTIGFGRSKVNEHLDASIKYKVMEQMKGGFPMSIVVFANTGVIPRKNIGGKFPSLASRMSYSYQAIFTKKINWRTSIGLLPTFVHRNRVSNDVNADNGSQDQNDLFSMAAMGRFKITQSVGVIAEYFYTVSEFRKNNATNPYYMPLGVGVEIETGGHVFQINFTNAAGIIYNDFIPSSSDSWDSGAFKVGFTISRVFGG